VKLPALQPTLTLLRMGVGGKAIPPFIDRVTGIQSDAQFILLVEKEAAYMRLAEDRCPSPPSSPTRPKPPSCGFL
jgi:DNA topoisomerase VI subunit A